MILGICLLFGTICYRMATSPDMPRQDKIILGVLGSALYLAAAYETGKAVPAELIGVAMYGLAAVAATLILLICGWGLVVDRRRRQ